MDKRINIYEAKTHLSRLLRRVEAGEDILIKRGSVAVARIVAVSPPSQREFGKDRGRFEVPEDFDSALPEEVLRDFE